MGSAQLLRQLVGLWRTLVNLFGRPKMLRYRTRKVSKKTTTPDGSKTIETEEREISLSIGATAHDLDDGEEVVGIMGSTFTNEGEEDEE